MIKEIQYHFEKVVCISLRVAIYINFAEVQTTRWWVKGLHRIFLLTHNIKPPPKRLRSRLKTL